MEKDHSKVILLIINTTMLELVVSPFACLDYSVFHKFNHEMSKNIIIKMFFWTSCLKYEVDFPDYFILNEFLKVVSATFSLRLFCMSKREHL